MKTYLRLILAVSSVTFIACAPDPRSDDDNGGGDDDTMPPPPGFIDAAVLPPTTCTPMGPEVCSGNLDEDCDGHIDCHDPNCSGVGNCPVCGQVQHPLGTPLALPDGTTPPTSYTSALHFTGFGPTQTLAATSDIVSVCVTMEHTWLRDLQIDLVAPSGQTLALQQFLGQTGSELFMGTPIDDDGISPTPGTGSSYCWTPTATRPAMLEWANQNPGVNLNADNIQVLPSGDYASAMPFAGLVGATLNGDWTIKITDLWQSDNGYIFEWSIAFNPMIVEDCEEPPVQ